MTDHALLNEQYPGHTPPGTRVEVVGHAGTSVFIKVGKKVVKVAPAWIDMEPEPERLVRRRVRVNGSILDD